MYVTANIYERVVQVVTPSALGAGFTIEHEGACYLVTARHVLPTEPAEEFEVIHRDSIWKGTAAPRSGVNPGADIAVVRVPDEFGKPHLPVSLTSDGMAYSEDMFFLGYPYGLALTVNAERQLPLVKKAILSGSNYEAGGLNMLYLDGLNNPGFSGGPVVTMRMNPPQIVAVVSGYRIDWQRLHVNRTTESPLEVQTNSGIIIAYDIRHAMEVF